jgi:hypothetical protein
LATAAAAAAAAAAGGGGALSAFVVGLWFGGRPSMGRKAARPHSR